MPLETGQYISDLNASNPAHSDSLAQTDAHLRLIKTALLNTFPSVTGPTTITQAQLNQLATGVIKAADGSSAAPGLSFTTEATLGFYRVASAKLGFTGRLLGNGAHRTGELVVFVRDPGTALMARGGTATGTEEFIELDGSAYAQATFPDLASIYGVATGNFSVDNAKDTGRFIRSRTSTLFVGSRQASAFKTHIHGVSQSAAGAHTHTVSISDPGHTHFYLKNVNGASASGVSSGGNLTNGETDGISNVSNTGITASVNPIGDHTHSVSISAGTDGGDSAETRPESLVVIYAVKT